MIAEIKLDSARKPRTATLQKQEKSEGLPVPPHRQMTPISVDGSTPLSHSRFKNLPYTCACACLCVLLCGAVFRQKSFVIDCLSLCCALLSVLLRAVAVAGFCGFRGVCACPITFVLSYLLVAFPLSSTTRPYTPGRFCMRVFPCVTPHTTHHTHHTTTHGDRDRERQREEKMKRSRGYQDEREEKRDTMCLFFV